MYSNPYEEYMRNSLGYNVNPMMNMNQMESINQMMNMKQMGIMNEMYEGEGNFTCNQATIDDMYPEIYRIVYPLVCKACMAVNENVTDDLVSRITNEIYMNIEHTEIAQETRNVNPIEATSINKNLRNDAKVNSISSSTSSNTRQETRQRNPLLRDLIRILVLRELIGNPGRPRPPFRPPFGGGAGPRPYMF